MSEDDYTRRLCDRAARAAEGRLAPARAALAALRGRHRYARREGQDLISAPSREYERLRSGEISPEEYAAEVAARSPGPTVKEYEDVLAEVERALTLGSDARPRATATSPRSTHPLRTAGAIRALRAWRRWTRADN